MIFGSGPNRVGQGIEFDYCCCHASFALQEADYESIMVNCNPETVSTDYDTSDRLYFEPLTLENVLNIFDTEKPDGVMYSSAPDAFDAAAPAQGPRGAHHRHRPGIDRSGGRPGPFRKASRGARYPLSANGTAPAPRKR